MQRQVETLISAFSNEISRITTQKEYDDLKMAFEKLEKQLQQKGEQKGFGIEQKIAEFYLKIFDVKNQPRPDEYLNNLKSKLRVWFIPKDIETRLNAELNQWHSFIMFNRDLQNYKDRISDLEDLLRRVSSQESQWKNPQLSDQIKKEYIDLVSKIETQINVLYTIRKTRAREILEKIKNNTLDEILSLNAIDQFNIFHDKDALDELIALLYSNDSVQKLHLNNLKRDLVNTIWNALEQKQNLQVLICNSCELYRLMPLVLTVLRNNVDSLMELSLSNNQISDHDAVFMAQIFDTPHAQLENLNLSFNEIQESGAIAISKLLKFNKLKDLNLAGNSIETQGIIAIANMLKTNTSLLKLDLTDIEIQDEYPVEMAEALKINVTLISLGIHTDEDNEDDVETSLILALQNDNFSLTEIDITKIDDDPYYGHPGESRSVRINYDLQSLLDRNKNIRHRALSKVGPIIRSMEKHPDTYSSFEDMARIIYNHQIKNIIQEYRAANEY